MNSNDIIFELAEDVEMEYLVQFFYPATGVDRCIIPRGTSFKPQGKMRDDALYINMVNENDELMEKMSAQVKEGKYGRIFDKLAGFSFFITREQIKTLPLLFHNGKAEDLIALIEQPYWENDTSDS